MSATSQAQIGWLIMCVFLEVSASNRAGCQDALCKAEGRKIEKGAMRFGTWVEIQEHGSWRWKHWYVISHPCSFAVFLLPQGTSWTFVRLTTDLTEGDACPVPKSPASVSSPTVRETATTTST
jgi:hypothetical protein